MAEFCVDCWNRLNGTDEKEEKYFLTKHLDLCEDCGEYKHVIIIERKYYYKRIFKFITFPLYVVWRCLVFPFLYYKYKKELKRINEKNKGK